MKAFRVKGTFKDVRAGNQPFSIEIADENEEAAKEQIVSTLGSRHKLKRWEINIIEIVEIAKEDIENHVVKYKVGA